MCGIFGIFQKNGQSVDLNLLQRAAKLLRHRGPDDEGYLLINTSSGKTVSCGGIDTMPGLIFPPVSAYKNEIFDLAFAFRRLAVIDLSPGGHQPMASANGSLWIVFNGEIYNYRSLREELKGKGHFFHTATDTEVVLAAYLEWGETCLDRLEGMWAFALWDNPRGRLFLARDPFGIKPLYYLNENDKFIFGSEIKALVTKGGTPFQPDDESIYRYLMGGDLPSPRQGRTFFRNVFSLPAAHKLHVDRTSNSLQGQRYWNLPELSDGGDHSPAEVVDRYQELFFETVRFHLQSDVPIGSCLSGGVDSSSIVCVVNHLMRDGGISIEQIGERQKTFSAVYQTPGRYNERGYVEKVIEATHAEANFVFPSLQRLQEEIEDLIWHQEEPFGSTSIFAQWCVMKMARERGVTVLLDGQGADELLGGYRPFGIYLNDVTRRAGWLRAWQEARVIESVTNLGAFFLMGEALIRRFPLGWTRSMRRQRARQQSDLSVLQPDFAAGFRHQTHADWVDWSEHMTLNQHLWTILEESSLPHLLRYEDRNSMAFGVEARVPFLERRLVEFSFTVAAKWRIHQGWTKWILRQAMEGIVPPEVNWRTDKVGFETPEGDWLRQWLTNEKNILGKHALSAAYLDLQVIRTRMGQWIEKGRDPGPDAIWRWVCLEMWLRCAKRFGEGS